MRLKNMFKFIFSIALPLILSACLPQQKTTQCGDSEAFNATQRKCVPVLGAATSNTVFINSKYPSNNYTTSVTGSSVQHGVSVSDVYDHGYSIKWLLHYTSGSVNTTALVSADTLTYTFHPSMSFGAGSYILEAVVYNSSNGTNLDSYSWSIAVSDQEMPTFVNPVPNSYSTSFFSNVSVGALSVDISNPDGLSGQAFWVIDGVTTQVADFDGTTTGYSTTINPQSMGVGIHTVEMKLTDINSSSNIYDSYVWIVNVVDPDFPVITNSPDPGFNHTILAIDGQAMDSANGGFFYDHDSDPSTELENLYTKPNTGGTPGICVSVDNWDKDGDSIADIYLVFDINGAQQGPQIPLNSNTYCLDETYLSAQTLTNPEVGVSKNLNVSTYESGTSNLVEQRSWALNVIPKNSAPVIQISSNTDSMGCSGTGVLQTGCSATQSVDNDLNGSYADAGDVDNTIKFAIDVLTDFETDYVNDGNANGEDNNAVYFQVKKDTDGGYQDIDGNSSYTKANCVVASGDKSAVTDSSVPTGAITTYYCEVSFDAFASNGPIASGDYEVKAYITDAGSVWGGLPKDSNSVKWEVTVNEYQSAPVITAQVFNDAVPTDDGDFRSYFTSANSSCVDSGTVIYDSNSLAEGDYVMLHSFVKDLERDDFSVSVKMENLVAGSGSYSAIYGPQSITRIDDTEYYEVLACFQIPEWANTAGQQAVRVVATVTDSPDNPLAAISVSNQSTPYYINVDNVNPPPTFADYASVENIKNMDGSDSPEQIYVFSGFPFTIDPPSYTDASVYDGEVVSWQWQVCVGDPNNAAECDTAGPLWTDIPSADSNQVSDTLVWTPAPDIVAGSTVNIRMCLGDNGDGNPADCSGAAESRKTYTNIIANPPATRSPASLAVEPGGTELATWHDSSDSAFYLAYAAGSSIYVEKFTNDSNGAWTQEHSISFASDDTSPAAVSDLSMIGSEAEALIISYKINYSGNPRPRVRRLDISNDLLTFSYTGVYDAGESGDSDMVGGIGNANEGNLVNSTWTEVGGDLNIEFSDAPTAGSSIVFRLNGASDVTLTAGTDFCVGVACTGGGSAAANAALAAGDLRDAINAHSDLLKELSASVTTGTNPNDTVVVSGPVEGDYEDYNGELALSLGDVIIVNDAWYIPYADGSAGLKASIIIGQDPGTVLTSYVGASTPVVNSHSNMTEVQMRGHGQNPNGFFLAAIADGELHTYLLDATGAITHSNEDIYGSAMTIKEIDVTVDDNDTAWVAGISQDASGDRYLNAAVFTSTATTLSVVAKTEYFLPGNTNSLAKAGIDQVSITDKPSSGTTSSIIVALTTKAAHADIPNQAHLLELSKDTSDLSNIVFGDYQLAGQPAPPAFNLNPVSEGAAIALSPIINFTKGHTDENPAGGADNAQDSVIFTFHEFNAGVPADEIRTGIYNIQKDTGIVSDDTATGSYPAFLSN